MKIGQKLFLALIIFALFFAANGVVTILNMKTFATQARDSYQRVTQPFSVLMEIAVNHQKIRVALRNILLHTDPEQGKGSPKRLPIWMNGLTSSPRNSRKR